jgi:hypothetical protein
MASRFEVRNQEIRKLHVEGIGWLHLSKLYGVSQFRIRQICGNKPCNGKQRRRIRAVLAEVLAKES